MIKCSRCGIEFAGDLSHDMCSQCEFYTNYGWRWYVTNEACMFCQVEIKTLFPGGVTSLACKNCGKLNETPFEKEEVTEQEARDICTINGIKLEDLMT